MTPRIGTIVIRTGRMDALAAFYERHLGIGPFERFGEDHRGIRVGDVWFGLDRAEDAEPPGPVSLWFTVDDPDHIYERAVAAGDPPKKPPTDTPWGDRIAALLDPDGNTVGLSRRP